MARSYLFIIILFFISCQSEEPKKPAFGTKTIQNQYAEGFLITTKKKETVISVSKAWPNTKQVFTYTLVSKKNNLKKPEPVRFENLSIPTPIKSVVVTSTTDIPMLEALHVDSLLVGFPNLQYIASIKTQKRIQKNELAELGNSNVPDVERILSLQPDVVIAFSSNGDLKGYQTILNAGIPVVLNGSWAEKHPLGRAEWIKFIAAFFKKEKEAATLFDRIVDQYNETKKTAHTTLKKPLVFNGSCYKDTWYVPAGGSYMAQLMHDANMDYPWKTDTKSGSLSLSFEHVYTKANNADLALIPEDVASLEALRAKNRNYSLLKAYKSKQVYTPVCSKLTKEPSLFYELGALRPDLILKDLVQIAHPKLGIQDSLFFYTKLK